MGLFFVQLNGLKDRPGFVWFEQYDTSIPILQLHEYH